MNAIQLSRVLRESRLRQGLTQSKLAFESGVSLPAIQQLESGRGNPSLSTLEALFNSLRLKLRAEPEVGADWDFLAACGAPLTTGGSAPQGGPRPTAPGLARALRAAALDEVAADGKEAGGAGARRRDALSALLLALKTHYPSWYAKNCRSPALRRLTPVRPEGRHLKLRRMALDRLAEYL